MIAGLIRGLLKLSAGHRRQGDAHVATGAGNVHVFHRRGEIEHVKTAQQGVRNCGVGETGNQLAAFFTHIAAELGIGEGDDNTAFAFLATAEVDIADAARTHGGFAAGGDRAVGDQAGDDTLWSRGLAGDFDDDVVAFGAQGVRHRFGQVDHHARATARFNQFDFAGDAHIDFLAALAQSQRGVPEINGQAGGFVDAEHRRLRRRVRQGEGEQHAVAVEGDKVHRIERARVGGRSGQREHQGG